MRDLHVFAIAMSLFGGLIIIAIVGYLVTQFFWFRPYFRNKNEPKVKADEDLLNAQKEKQIVLNVRRKRINNKQN